MLVLWLTSLAGYAQSTGEPLNVMEGSLHLYHIDSNPIVGQYTWEVYDDVSLTTLTDGSKAETSASNTAGQNETSIQWKKPGTYYLAVTAESKDGCENTMAWKINVQPNTTSIAFNPKEAGDCADPNTPTSNTTATVELFAADGVPLPNSNYPVTVDYTVTKPDGTTQNLSQTLQDATDVSLPLNGLVNDVSQDQVYDVVLVKATDKYGMEIHVSADAGTFQYTIFKTPVTPEIKMN